MTEWMLWIAIAGGAGDALELNRYETKEKCEWVRSLLIDKIKEANGEIVPKKLMHQCSEVVKQR